MFWPKLIVFTNEASKNKVAPSFNTAWWHRHVYGHTRWFASCHLRVWHSATRLLHPPRSIMFHTLTVYVWCASYVVVLLNCRLSCLSEVNTVWSDDNGFCCCWCCRRTTWLRCTVLHVTVTTQSSWCYSTAQQRSTLAPRTCWHRYTWALRVTTSTVPVCCLLVEPILTQEPAYVFSTSVTHCQSVLLVANRHIIGIAAEKIMHMPRLFVCHLVNSKKW